MVLSALVHCDTDIALTTPLANSPPPINTVNPASPLSNGSKNTEPEYPQGHKPWTPEPEPYDPDKYVAWGKKHYGDDWYEQRKALFHENDTVKYKKRQEALRQIEREKEAQRKPVQTGIKENENRAQATNIASTASPSNVLQSVESGGDPVSSLSDGSEYSNTDYEEERTPEPDDPEARLLWARKHYGEAYYQEALAEREAAQKLRREDEECERIEQKKVDAIRTLRRTDPERYEREMREYNRQFAPPEEQTLAAIRLIAASVRADPIFRHSESLFARRKPQPAAIAERANGLSEVVGLSDPRATPRQPQKRTKGISYKTLESRITKNTKTTANRGTRSRRAAPTLTEVLIPDSRPKRLRQAPDIMDQPGDSTAQVPEKPRKRQPKVYEKKRASRRLAGQPPEFGILLSQAEIPPLYGIPSQNRSSTRKPHPSGVRNRAPSKGKSITVKGAKPQGISKSPQERTNRPKRSNKRSEG